MRPPSRKSRGRLTGFLQGALRRMDIPSRSEFDNAAYCEATDAVYKAVADLAAVSP